MHCVVIHGWKAETPELVQALSGALGITAFEARQRMIGKGPVVVANFADQGQALALAKKLNQNGIATLVVAAAEVGGSAGYFIVRRFELNQASLRIEQADRQHAEIPYGEIDLLLPAASIVEYSEKKPLPSARSASARPSWPAGYRCPRRSSDRRR